MAFNNKANNTKCPCKECDRRTVTCHGVCEGYQEWKKSEAVRIEAERRAREADGMMISDARLRRKWRDKRYSRQGGYGHGLRDE